MDLSQSIDGSMTFKTPDHQIGEKRYIKLDEKKIEIKIKIHKYKSFQCLCQVQLKYRH